MQESLLAPIRAAAYTRASGGTARPNATVYFSTARPRVLVFPTTSAVTSVLRASFFTSTTPCRHLLLSPVAADYRSTPTFSNLEDTKQARPAPSPARQSSTTSSDLAAAVMKIRRRSRRRKMVPSIAPVHTCSPSGSPAHLTSKHP